MPYSVGQDLGALAQRHRPLVGMPRVDESPAERRRVHLLVIAFVRLCPAWRTTHGARLIDSTPPAMQRSASPTAISPTGRHHGLETRSAQPVLGHARAPRSAAPASRLAMRADVAVLLAGTVAVAEVHVVEAAGIELG